jgi:cell division protein FtsB
MSTQPDYVPAMERQHWPTAETEMYRLLDECARLAKENAVLREERDMLERRARMVAGSNADDWRWYQNAAKQAVRSLDDRRKRK